MADKGWIGVDLDGTLAEYDGWKGIEHIGEPVEKMVQRVKTMLAQGKEVRIFTARVYPEWAGGYQIIGYNEQQIRNFMDPIQYGKWYNKLAEAALAKLYIERWCENVFGQKLKVTCTKDPGMVSLFDDRAIQVEPNTGDTLEDKLWRTENKGMVADFNRISPRQG